MRIWLSWLSPSARRDFDELARMRSGRPPLSRSEAEIAAGRQVFLSKPCAACHTVRGTPAAGTTGPDLTHVGSRQYIAAGLLPDDARLARGLDRRPADAKARQQHADGAADAGRAALGLRLHGEPEMKADVVAPDTARRRSSSDRGSTRILSRHLEDAAGLLGRARHRRSQDHRPPLHRHRLRLPGARRRPCRADALAARAARKRGCSAPTATTRSSPCTART